MKPIAAALVGFWLAHKLSAESSLPWYAISVAVLGGVPATYGLQIAKTKARAGLSVATLGVFHPIVSGFENVVGFFIALAFTLHPLVGIFLAIAVFLPIGWGLWIVAKALARGARKVHAQISGKRTYS